MTIKFENWNFEELNLEIEVFENYILTPKDKIKKKKVNALENSHAQPCTRGGFKCKGKVAL